MSDADLRRLREDLHTIHQAAGVGLPFDRADVWEALALVPAGALLAAWAFFAPGDSLAVGLVPPLLLALAAAVRRVWRRPGGTPALAARQPDRTGQRRGRAAAGFRIRLCARPGDYAGVAALGRTFLPGMGADAGAHSSDGAGI